MASTTTSKLDRESITPFLVKVFYRTGAFHRPDEFAAHHLLPHLQVHTWPSCTLAELTHHLAAATPPLLPDPAIGTRLAFRLIFPDTRGGPGGGNGPARFVVKDLGSVLIGDGGPGVTVPDDDDGDLKPNSNEAEEKAVKVGVVGLRIFSSDAVKTLGDVKFVVGDYISCAILPPLANGAVSSAAAARTGRGSGLGEGRSLMGVAPPPRRNNASPPRRRVDKFRRRGGDARDAGDFGMGMPDGEWRRGEKLPYATPPTRGNGRGRR